MLIKALNEYYDILARNDKVCKDGFFKTEYHAYDYAEKRRYSKRYYKRGAGK